MRISDWSSDVCSSDLVVVSNGAGPAMAELPHATLITGGAGYIGSHNVLALRQAGRRIVVLDDLSTGNRRVVTDDVDFVAGDAGDRALVASLTAAEGVALVIHFAGKIGSAQVWNPGTNA